MAKSLRSKRKRKLRAVKREKYSKRELERLKNMIATAKTKEEEMSEIVTVTKPHAKKKPVVDADGDVAMDGAEADAEAGASMDIAKPKSKVNPKTLKTEHGNFPVWISHRKIIKLKKKHKKAVKQKMKAKTKK